MKKCLRCHRKSETPLCADCNAELTAIRDRVNDLRRNLSRLAEAEELAEREKKQAVQEDTSHDNVPEMRDGV